MSKKKHKKPRALSLVKYDYNSLPAKWRKNNPNSFDGCVFCYLGPIPNMKGHCYVQDVDSGKSLILHTENMVELNKDEV
jgi:hypothetical protein